MGRHRKLQPTNAERTIWGRGDGRDVFLIDSPLGRLVVCAQSRIGEGTIERLGPVGQPDKIRTGGGLSAIVAPNATYIAGPHRDDEAIVYGEIDLSMIPFAKFFADSAGHYARPHAVWPPVTQANEASV